LEHDKLSVFDKSSIKAMKEIMEDQGNSFNSLHSFGVLEQFMKSAKKNDPLYKKYKFIPECALKDGFARCHRCLDVFTSSGRERTLQHSHQIVFLSQITHYDEQMYSTLEHHPNYTVAKKANGRRRYMEVWWIPNENLEARVLRATDLQFLNDKRDISPELKKMLYSCEH
jgi:hypothetical protein